MCPGVHCHYLKKAPFIAYGILKIYAFKIKDRFFYIWTAFPTKPTCLFEDVLALALFRNMDITEFLFYSKKKRFV